MSFPKRKFREIIFQLLYSHDFLTKEEDKLISLVMEKVNVTKRIVREAYSYVKKIIDNLESLDEKIKKVCISYEFNRISKTELNIIRLSLYEILFEEEISKSIAISEGIRLCRKFSSPEGANFVNAILDAIEKNEV